MKNSIIQSQITLISFKAVNLNYFTEATGDPIQGEDSDFQLQIGNLLINDSPNRFAKVFNVNLKILNPHFKEIINIQTEFHTVFQSSEKIDDVFLESDFANISAPAIGFPYLRAFISNLSIQAGIAPIILPSINFVQFNMDAKKK